MEGEAEELEWEEEDEVGEEEVVSLAMEWQTLEEVKEEKCMTICCP